MVKNKKRESWTLKMLRDFYFHQHYIYLKNRLNEEDRMPTVRTVEDINNKFESVGMFFRDYESEYQAKRLGDFNLFMNEDLEDCIRPLSTAEIDPSIINLRNDPHKHVIFSKNRKDDVLCSLDK